MGGAEWVGRYGEGGGVTYWSFLSSLFRYMTHDAPFVVKPYLWQSIEMEVTPFVRKSHGGMSFRVQVCVNV